MRGVVANLLGEEEELGQLMRFIELVPESLHGSWAVLWDQPTRSRDPPVDVAISTFP